MKTYSLLTATTALVGAVALPGLAEARTVTIKTELTNYGGSGAYLAYYVTDPSGKYVGSLWMAGGRSRYYRHLSAWQQASGGDPNEVAGVTGASVGQGQTLTLDFNIADSLFDAGYTLHVDVAAEQMRESADDVALPLTSTAATVQGAAYIASLSYQP